MFLCNTCNQPTPNCSCTKVKTDNVTYTGPNLTCTNVETNDDMTLVIKKLNDSVCNLTTTSTTTTVLNCRVWEAVLSQNSTNAPTINLVNSTLGEIAISSTYISVGVYRIKFFGIPSLSVNKTILLTTGSVDGSIYAKVFSASEIQIQTVNNTNAQANDILFQTSLYLNFCLTVPAIPTTTTTTTVPATTTTTTT